MIKIDFQLEYKELTFSDSIVLPENHSFSESQIDKIKQDRFEKWKAVIDATVQSED